MLKSLTLVFLILLSITVNAAQFIAPGNDNIRYTGRWDRTNQSQPWAYAKGTSLIANFHGNRISATFSDTSTDYLRIIIDDAASESIKIQVSSGAFSYVLASGLGDGSHKIEIVKETDAGRWSFHGFNIEGDPAGIEDPPAILTRKLVFYGDSNLAGDSLEHEQNQSARSLRGSYYGFAGIVSRMFNAQYSNISRSGASIRSLHTSFDFRGQHIWTDPLDSTTVTKDLTTTWAHYEITATAPPNAEDPVFQTRFTFQAATGSSVDIDNVVMILGNEPDLCTDDDGDGYGNPGSSDCDNGAGP